MRIRALWLGRTKNPHLASVCEDFVQRGTHFVNLEVVEIKEPRFRDEKKRIEVEGEGLLEAIDRSDFVVALDAAGRSYTSNDFASFLGKHLAENPRDLIFIVGGHAGLSEAVKKRADLLWSLSPLTYSHDLARAVLLEQVYRALTIIHNHPYAR